MKVLEIRPEQVICIDNGKLTTKPNSPYYSLKYFYSGGNRIAYTFSDVSCIKETFDDRIFNCWCNGKRLQLRQDLSEKLAVAINHHMESGDVQKYEELFNLAYKEQPNWQILDIYLRNVEGVSQTSIGYIIYDSFRIDFKGNAWVCGNYGNNIEEYQINCWNSLCIVMQGAGNSHITDEGTLFDENGSIISVNALTITILTKILFLLNPNLKDSVFTSQLPENLLKMLNNMEKSNNE